MRVSMRVTVHTYVPGIQQYGPPPTRNAYQYVRNLSKPYEKPYCGTILPYEKPYCGTILEQP